MIGVQVADAVVSRQSRKFTQYTIGIIRSMSYVIM